MSFNRRNATLVLSILTSTSSPDHPCLSMILPRYLRASNFSRASSTGVVSLVFAVLYFNILILPCECWGLLLCKPLLHGLSYFACVAMYGIEVLCHLEDPIVQVAQCIPGLFKDVEVFIIQLTTRRKRKSESNLSFSLGIFLMANVYGHFEIQSLLKLSYAGNSLSRHSIVSKKFHKVFLLPLSNVCS